MQRKSLFRCTAVLLVWSLSAFEASQSMAQNNQLRGLPQSGNSLLPSAQQQLQQNLNRQQNTFSTRQQIDSANKLNRTDQINRLNTQPDRTTNPCPGANAACNEAR